MRITMIGPFAWAPKGTVSARAFLMARALVARGHQVTILMPPYDNPAHAGYEWEQDGVRLVNLRLPTWGDSLQARLTVPVAMARRASRSKPDLVHVFKPTGYSGLTGLYLRRFRPRLPVALDADDWEGRGGWADVKAYPPLWRAFFDWQETWLVHHADVVTVASRALQARVTAMGVPPACVFYIPNGPSDLFKESRVTEGEKDELRRTLGVERSPWAVYIGHITYGSEVNLALEALPRVIEALPGFRIVIVGAGEGLEALQAQVRDARLEEHVTFTGWVDPARSAVYLASADLALYPYRDTAVNRAKSPSKITAYMATGKPIVASAVGEIVEYLDEGRAGLLVPPGDAEAFARGVIALARDPARAEELGRRARERIWNNYDWAHQIVPVEQAYHFSRTRINTDLR